MFVKVLNSKLYFLNNYMTIELFTFTSIYFDSLTLIRNFKFSLSWWIYCHNIHSILFSYCCDLLASWVFYILILSMVYVETSVSGHQAHLWKLLESHDARKLYPFTVIQTQLLTVRQLSFNFPVMIMVPDVVPIHEICVTCCCLSVCPVCWSIFPVSPCFTDTKIACWFCLLLNFLLLRMSWTLKSFIQEETQNYPR